MLAITSPGASCIGVFEPKKDIQGNRKAFGNRLRPDMHQTTLPAGDYAIVVTMPDNAGTKEGTATVKAGERTEVTVQ